MATNPNPPAHVIEEPITLGLSVGNAWLIAGTFFSLLLFYVVGIDQGAVSLLGNDTHIHEWVHDARHLLGYACH